MRTGVSRLRAKNDFGDPLRGAESGEEGKEKANCILLFCFTERNYVSTTKIGRGARKNKLKGIKPQPPKGIEKGSRLREEKGPKTTCKAFLGGRKTSLNSPLQTGHGVASKSEKNRREAERGGRGAKSDKQKKKIWGGGPRGSGRGGSFEGGR